MILLKNKGLPAIVRCGRVPGCTKVVRFGHRVLIWRRQRLCRVSCENPDDSIACRRAAISRTRHGTQTAQGFASEKEETGVPAANGALMFLMLLVGMAFLSPFR